MNEVGKELVSSKPIVIIILGTLLLVFGSADTITVGTFSSSFSTLGQTILILSGIVFVIFGMYQMTKANKTLSQQDNKESKSGIAPIQYPFRSAKSKQPSAHITFTNSSDRSIELVWINYVGQEKRYDEVQPNNSHTQESFSTHPWLVKDASTHENIFLFIPRNQEPQHFYISIEDINLPSPPPPPSA